MSPKSVFHCQCQVTWSHLPPEQSFWLALVDTPNRGKRCLSWTSSCAFSQITAHFCRLSRFVFIRIISFHFILWITSQPGFFNFICGFGNFLLFRFKFLNNTGCPLCKPSGSVPSVGRCSRLTLFDHSFTAIITSQFHHCMFLAHPFLKYRRFAQSLCCSPAPIHFF